MSTKLESVNRRGFSIELSSGSDLKRLKVPNGTRRILVEGTIGALRHAEFVEDSVLELVGSNGVIRIDFSKGDLSSASRKAKRGDEK